MHGLKRRYKVHCFLHPQDIGYQLSVQKTGAFAHETVLFLFVRLSDPAGCALLWSANVGNKQPDFIYQFSSNNPCINYSNVIS